MKENEGKKEINLRYEGLAPGGHKVKRNVDIPVLPLVFGSQEIHESEHKTLTLHYTC